MRSFLLFLTLEAAKGSPELCVPDSAWEEIESIPAEDRAHPTVLWMRLEIYRKKQKWDGMVEIAKHLVKVEPHNPCHWVHLAWAERRAINVEKAEQTLIGALDQFPEVGTIHYNIACYCCVSGRVDEGKERLERAFELDPSLRVDALDDEDLVGVW
jgi:Tfp pilus assembly protein PilF